VVMEVVCGPLRTGGGQLSSLGLGLSLWLWGSHCGCGGVAVGVTALVRYIVANIS
jgi:hypothetical protein